MPAATNQVRAVYDVDIRDTLRSAARSPEESADDLAKGNAAALGEIRKTLPDEVAKVRDQATKGKNELKLAKTEELMRQLKDPISVAYKRLKTVPTTIKARWSRTRCARRRGFPRREPASIEAENTRVLLAGKATLLKCDQELIAFGRC